MSEPVETSVGYLKILDYGETVVMLSGQGVLTIPAEHRQAVALALLGGVTDELVERAAIGAVRARLEVGDPGRDWGDDRRREARMVLNAAFGIVEP